jgi:hypothetical protein
MVLMMRMLGSSAGLTLSLAGRQGPCSFCPEESIVLGIWPEWREAQVPPADR